MPSSPSPHEPVRPNGKALVPSRINGPAAPRLSLDDLVARAPLHVDREGLQRYLADRTVLVTGAGGSIGTELARRLRALRPAHLVLVDVSEHNLFELERQLGTPAHAPPLTFCLADVQNDRSMETLFTTHAPDVVLHAAAYKHVPLMERHPAAAFRNNTVATARLLRQCDVHGVDQFVLVSTDKAVEPISVLGATKRLAEWYVRRFETSVTCKIVRFGNVFGTRGSVVPRFERQLAAGGPLQVTHPEMERYFMSAEAASGLILQTPLLDTAPIYALQMDDPIRIRWLAEQIVRRFVPECDPADWIVYTGRRPGEKLREKLYASSETSRPTEHPHILGLDGPLPTEATALDALLDRLLRLADAGTADQLYEALPTENASALDAAS